MLSSTLPCALSTPPRLYSPSESRGVRSVAALNLASASLYRSSAIRTSPQFFRQVTHVGFISSPHEKYCIASTFP